MKDWYLAKQSSNFIVLNWLYFWQNLSSNVVCVLTFCFVFDETCWAMLSSPEWGDLFVYSEFVWNVIICKWSSLFLTKVKVNQCRSHVCKSEARLCLEDLFVCCQPVWNVNRHLSSFSCDLVMCWIMKALIPKNQNHFSTHPMFLKSSRQSDLRVDGVVA